MRSILLSCVLLHVTMACQAPAEEVPAPPPAAPPLPASALTGAVRALETVHAVRPAGTYTRVRAISSDTRTDPVLGFELERVFLDVTVFAATNAQAVEGFEALRAALEEEARAGTRVEPASAGRVRAALERIEDVPPGAYGRGELVSYSDRIRLDIRPGEQRSAPDAPEVRREVGVDSLANYVRERAARADSVGGVALRPANAPAVGGLRCELRPAEPFQRFTLGQIAAFLSSLENESPFLRLTRFELEPSQHEPDPASPRRWTFEAELLAGAATPIPGS